VGPEEYEVIDYPKSRLATVDVGRFGHNTHYVFGLLEIDVTEARQRLRKLRQQGQETSFTAWMIKTIGDCVARNIYAQAMRWKSRKLIAFKDVDIAIPVERVIGGKGVPLPLLLKQTNRKSALDIHHEIQAALQKSIADEKDFILNPHQFSRLAMQLYYLAPQPIRLFLWRRIFVNPFRARKNSGTVMVTTVNAVDGSTGWIVPSRSIHNIALSFGSISKKPWVVHDKVEARDILHLTVTFNHDVIDGVPARRFVQDLVKAIEKRGAQPP
jgi:chloramphenicol O-acetyltransferase